ncbi:MAG TPA: hypothetical protein PLD93_02645, partial [Synergistaceae bacterium]|nr:hypothetical protein [Synergistaceae bacterium]
MYSDDNVSSAMSDAMLASGTVNVLALPIFSGENIWGMLCVESGPNGPEWDTGLIGALEIGAEVLELIVLNYNNRRGLLHS